MPNIPNAWRTPSYCIRLPHVMGKAVPLKRAHRPDRELRRFLLSVRKNQVAVEDAKALLSDVKRKAIAASEFYIASPDTDFLHDAEFELRKLLGL